MIERCDRALYQAKRSGRNCTVKESSVDEEIAA
jgi:PleD family two-component response regulator